jgi:4-amino-4-deoxy-L-arabinose transferase-like glycosyltransferase
MILKQRPALVWILAGCGVAVVGGVAYLWNLGRYGLIDETEPLFAEAARQMLLTGDWISPYFNREPRFDKPPLIYWLMGLAYQVVGVNSWGARLPSALSALGLLGFSFFTLRRFGLPCPPENSPAGDPGLMRWWTTLLGCTLMALSPLLVIWGRTGVSDMLLTACISGSMFAFFWGYAQVDQPQRQQRWFLFFYILLGLGTLTKGPVAIVLPVLGIVLFLLFLGKKTAIQVLQEARWLRGSLVVSAITIPWFLAITWQHGSAYVDDFFGYHNFERFTRVVNNHAAPWYFYLLIVLIGFLPFSVQLPQAMLHLRIWQRHQWQLTPRSQQLGLFACCWFVSVFGFFSIAVTKLPSYVLPLMPAAAILVALLWSEAITSPSPSGGWGSWVTNGINVLFLWVLAWLCWRLPHLLGPDTAAPDLPQALQMSVAVKAAALVWLVAAILSTLFLLLRRRTWIWGVMIVASLIFTALTATGGLYILDSQRQQPLRELAITAAEQRYPQEPLVMVGQKKPSVVFYSQLQVLFVRDPQELPRQLNDLAELDALESFLILGTASEIEVLETLGFTLQPLHQRGAYQLIRAQLSSLTQQPV